MKTKKSATPSSAVPKPSREPATRAVHAQEFLYQGPVPPPAILKQLEQLLPGAADRIFTMAEKDQEAAHEAQRKGQELAVQAANDTHTEAMTALWMAFAVCLVFTVGGVVLILHGFEKSGMTLIGVTLLGVVASFLRKWNRS